LQEPEFAGADPGTRFKNDADTDTRHTRTVTRASTVFELPGRSW
jgi:hypothetical protein